MESTGSEKGFEHIGQVILTIRIDPIFSVAGAAFAVSLRMRLDVDVSRWASVRTESLGFPS